MRHGAKQMKNLDLGHTVYTKTVVELLPDMPDPLKPAENNGKLHGNIVARGQFAGYAMYSLTLEERNTCSPDCGQLKTCYGNNMPFARRYVVTQHLLDRIEAQLRKLTRRGRRILLRLHILGDFFAVWYVDFWQRMLNTFPTVAIFGYTHWPIITPQGQAVERLVKAMPGRFCIKFSGDTVKQLPLAPLYSIGMTLVVKDWADLPKGFIRCPAQMAADKGVQGIGCAECGIKCADNVNVGFVEH